MPASAAFSLTTGGATLLSQAVTLTWVNPPAAPNMDFSFIRFWIGQSANTTSAQQRVQINTQVTAFPTMASATPTKLSIVSGASIVSGNTSGAAGTSGVNASAENGGAKTIIWADAFNVVNGYLLVLTPDEAIEVTAGSASGLGLHLPVAVATLTNWAFGCTWAEG